MEPKKWYTSKTLWLNFIAFVGTLLQLKFGFVISPTAQMIILTVLNYLVRVITKQPVVFTNGQ